MIRSRRRRLFALLAILGFYALCINIYFHESPSAIENSTPTLGEISKEKLMNEIQKEMDKVKEEEKGQYRNPYNATFDSTTATAESSDEQHNNSRIHKKDARNSKIANIFDKGHLNIIKPVYGPEDSKERLKFFEPRLLDEKDLGEENEDADNKKKTRLFNEHPENKADKNNFDYQKYVGIVRRHAQGLKDKCKKLEKKAFSPQDRMMIRLLAEPRPLSRKKGESLMDPDTGLLVCHTPKAGSSTWVNIFTHIFSVGSQSSRRGEMQQELWNVQNKKIEEALASTDPNAYFRIILVRHPFERLASAYKNKIVYNEPWILSKMILSIKEYVGKTNMSTADITFKDLVRYIVQWPKHKVDRHFLPMTIYCNPCLNNYDGIIKMDKFNEETKAVLIEKGYNDIAEQIPTLNNNAMTSSDNRFHEQYFTSLDLQEINDLYELFKWDFELFGYKNDLDRFYELVKV